MLFFRLLQGFSSRQQWIGTLFDTGCGVIPPGFRMGLTKKLRTFHPLMRTVPAELRTQAWSRVAVSTKHRFIYVRIPKAANSTIAKTLAAHMSPSERRQFTAEPTGELAKKSFDTLFHTRCLTQKGLLRNFFVFSFFRNPFSRLLSAYLDKVQSEFSRHKYQWIAETMNAASTEDMSFEDFVSFLEDGNLYKNVHWAPQVELCPFPVERLHFAGKIERLEQDMAVVINRLMGVGAFTGIVTRELNRQHASKRLLSCYNKDIVRRTVALYRDDFDRLGYGHELPGCR